MLGSVLDDILDDLFSLVDLHGKDGLISAGIIELLYSSHKCACDLIYPVLQHLGKAEEDGELQIPGFLYLLNEIHDIHGLIQILIGKNDDISLLVNRKIAV